MQPEPVGVVLRELRTDDTEMDPAPSLPRLSWC